MTNDEVLVSRRKVVAGVAVGTAAAAALVACGNSDTELVPAQSASHPKEIKESDVPVGSGKIFGDVVVTQPTPGVYKAFAAICTHQGCALTEVRDGTIDCPCHGSQFNLDGTVARGPAITPLTPAKFTAQTGSIELS